MIDEEFVAKAYEDELDKYVRVRLPAKYRLYSRVAETPGSNGYAGQFMVNATISRDWPPLKDIGNALAYSSTAARSDAMRLVDYYRAEADKIERRLQEESQ